MRYLSQSHFQPPDTLLIKSQQGMALLTILLLVVAITIVAGSMLASQKIMIRHYDVVQTQGQLRQYALAGEAMAQDILYQDSQINQSDSPQDSWAKPLPAYPMDTATVTVSITDNANKFNLNNLYHDGKVDEAAVQYLQALFVAQGIDSNIVMAILDWQDPDSEPHPLGGAEIDYYRSLGDPNVIPIANQPMRSVDELLFVRGMDKAKLAKIRSLVTTVPFYLPMNINTADPALLSIMPTSNPSSSDQPTKAANSPPTTQSQTAASQPAATAADNINPLQVQAWAATRQSAIALDQVDKLWALPAFSQVSAATRQEMTPLLSVQSQAFIVTVTVKQADKTYYLKSQIAKIDKNATNSPSVNSASLNPAASDTSPQTQIKVFERQFLPFSQ